MSQWVHWTPVIFSWGNSDRISPTQYLEGVPIKVAGEFMKVIKLYLKKTHTQLKQGMNLYQEIHDYSKPTFHHLAS